MIIAIICGIYIIEVFKYHLALEMVYKEKIQKRWSYYIGAVITFIYMIFAGGNAERNYLVAYACIMLATIFSISGNFKNKLVKSFLLCILITSIDEVVEGILLQIETTVKYVSHIHYWVDLLTSIWGLAVLSIVFFFYKRKKETLYLSKNKIIFVVVTSGVSLALTISSLNFAKDFVKNMNFQYFSDFVASLAYISLCLLCWFLVYFRNQDEWKAREIELEKMLKEEQKNYYQQLLKKEEDTRKFRHDMENHFFCIEALVNREDLIGLKRYLQNISGQMEKIRNMVYTMGNDLFDLILNDKISCLERETKVIVRGEFGQKLNVSDMDIYIIFSNLFQNAVEEINRQKKGWLFVWVQSGKHYTEVVVQNSVRKKKILQTNGLPCTLKEDKKRHGIGLQNVKSVVERNGGTFEITSREDKFEVRIQLHNQPIKKLTDR